MDSIFLFCLLIICLCCEKIKPTIENCVRFKRKITRKSFHPVIQYFRNCQELSSNLMGQDRQDYLSLLQRDLEESKQYFIKRASDETDTHLIVKALSGVAKQVQNNGTFITFNVKSRTNHPIWFNNDDISKNISFLPHKNSVCHCFGIYRVISLLVIVIFILLVIVTILLWKLLSIVSSGVILTSPPTKFEVEDNKPSPDGSGTTLTDSTSRTTSSPEREIINDAENLNHGSTVTDLTRKTTSSPEVKKIEGAKNWKHDIFGSSRRCKKKSVEMNLLKPSNSSTSKRSFTVTAEKRTEFYSPFTNDDDGTGTGSKDHFNIKCSLISKEDIELKEKAESLTMATLDILFSGGWSKESAKDSEDIVESKTFGGIKILRLQAVLDLSIHNLLTILYNEFEAQPKWNPSVLECSIIKRIDDSTDITYVVSAAACQGMVTSRDFVLLRHKAKIESSYIIASISTTSFLAPENKQFIRGENGPSCLLITPLPGNPSKSEFRWLFNSKLNGWLPTRIIDLAITSAVNDYLFNLRKYIGTLPKNTSCDDSCEEPKESEESDREADEVEIN